MLNCVLDLEGIAREVFTDMGERCPVSAFAIAEYCGVEVRAWMRNSGKRLGDRVWFPAAARSTRQHGVLAHELAHWLLEDAGMEHSCEASASYLAGALMVPSAPFSRDISRVDYDLEQLRKLHPNASAEMLVVRMTQLSPATAWVWDHGKLSRRYGTDEADVSEYVDRVLTAEKPVIDGAIGAWPVFDGRWRRVVVLKKSA